jgi:hypothetical protein
MSFFDLLLLITPLASSIIRPLCCLSLFDLRFWSPLWYFPTFGHCVVCPSIYASDYNFGIFKLLAIVLYCMSFDSRLLITPFVSSNCWPLCSLSFLGLRFLVTTLVSSNFWPLYLPVLPRFTGSDYLFGIFKHLAIVLTFFDLRLMIIYLVSSNIWPLHFLFFDLRLLITPLVTSNFFCILCSSTIIYIPLLLRACILYQRNQAILLRFRS